MYQVKRVILIIHRTLSINLQGNQQLDRDLQIRYGEALP